MNLSQMHRQAKTFEQVMEELPDEYSLEKDVWLKAAFSAASNQVDLIDPKAILKQETNHD